ncbi:translational activator of cytochrome c oxidase 1 [Apteryx mantelli]|uniref:Translational activator of cytochrome c oxidase 1 n=1 Tax=Apteryx mantelli TaxID=2696672 RepID=A0ABM4G1C3_9AVES
MAAAGALARARWPRLVAAGRPLHVGPAAWAGHNRWSKVRNVKGPRDAARSRLFQRLGMMLRAAAKEGGPDPALNAQLANVVEQCRAKNMPKASIEAALRGAEKASSSSSRLLYEARGPGGAALLLEVLTDNPRRSQQAVRLLLARHGGAMADGARHSFERKGVVRVAPRDRRGRPVSLEGALEAALDAGAQDVWEDEDEEDEEEPALKFVCEASALGAVRERLEAAGLLPLSAALEYLPRDTVPLAAAAQEQASRLLDALSTCPDVVRVYDNIR